MSSRGRQEIVRRLMADISRYLEFYDLLRAPDVVPMATVLVGDLVEGGLWWEL